MSFIRERAGSPSARLRTWLREKVRRVDLRVCHGSDGLVGVLGVVLGGVVVMAQTEPHPPRPMQWYSLSGIFMSVWVDVSMGKVLVCSA